MSSVNKNIAAPRIARPIVLGMNTTKNVPSPNTTFVNYTTAGTKKWYRQTSEKLSSFDWDINSNELEFE